MIRVLQLIDGRHYGGAEKVVLQLSTHLNREEFETYCVCVSEGRLFSELKNQAVKVQLIPMRGKFDFTIVLRLIKLIKKEKIDIIQSHTSRTNFLARLVSLFGGIKNISTIHSMIIKDTNESLRLKKWNARIDRWLSFLAHHFVSVSQQGQRELVASGIPASKVQVIYNGVEIQQFNLSPPEKRGLRMDLGLQPGTKVIGMIAALRPRKGAEYFIRAIPEVKKEIDKVQFLMVGDAEFVESRDYMAELRRVGRDSRVGNELIFTGFREDVARIMELLDVLVLPSLFGEGLPLVLLEGMAHSIPLVATDTEGNRELVSEGENGFLVPPYESHPIARRIIRLLKDNELRKRLGKRGRELVAEKFSLARSISQYESLYKSLVPSS